MTKPLAATWLCVTILAADLRYETSMGLSWWDDSPLLELTPVETEKAHRQCSRAYLGAVLDEAKGPTGTLNCAGVRTQGGGYPKFEEPVRAIPPDLME